MAIDSATAVRWLVHLAFRDAHTVLDLTHAHGGSGLIRCRPACT
jgi:hypothetical protein